MLRMMKADQNVNKFIDGFTLFKSQKLQYLLVDAGWVYKLYSIGIVKE